MIKIISGWSNQGGSTEAFIKLTNQLNRAGYETVFCGPHEYHLGKCRSELITNKLQLYKDDTLIVHFMKAFTTRPPVKKFILSCHEQDIFPLKNINYSIFDKIHYVSEHQKAFHNIDHPNFVCTNFVDDIKNNPKVSNAAGIIGSIDRNKQVHLSITRALNDGFDKIYIFGGITDPTYFETEVRPLIDGIKVVYVGFAKDKQKMYDSITHLYISSINECLPYVVIEAKMAGVEVVGIEGKNYLNAHYMTNEEVLSTWIKELN